ncbi:hypothetical protein M408DRAFT_127583 [Serendipita vermifera MAFF 305830]|uniref:Magnesium transporter n=1 Tax=Serendipita vermifera MAFF 305830 TaxID=933852 RepID=A0A0C2XJ11_SERVB|nr:hypothetical protein M408DRAFT_127583 [Serendipita vermifera MAFF 305830]
MFVLVWTLRSESWTDGTLGTRPSSEWASGCLRVHFLDQLTPIWMLFREDESNPVFITCTKLDPNQKLKTRWEDFVDFGDSRPDLLLRKDPSLMLYAMMRAVIQDLRFTASQKHRDMTAAYNLAMSKPSQKSLQYFYELQQSLIRIKLDTTSLRDAATNLIIFVDGMQKEASIIGKEPLISDDTQYMLKDQIGLITLLFEELPEVTRQAEAVANLAFNSLSFNTNNLLRLLAVLTMASVPLTIATGVLGVNYFSGDVVTGAT